jgi:hypothetical protein
VYIVKVNSEGTEFFLRSSKWTVEIERADKFSRFGESEVAIRKVKRFMLPALFKAVKIVELES